jgi:hypothetical protein
MRDSNDWQHTRRFSLPIRIFRHKPWTKTVCTHVQAPIRSHTHNHTTTRSHTHNRRKPRWRLAGIAKPPPNMSGAQSCSRTLILQRSRSLDFAICILGGTLRITPTPPQPPFHKSNREPYDTMNGATKRSSVATITKMKRSWGRQVQPQCPSQPLSVSSTLSKELHTHAFSNPWRHQDLNPKPKIVVLVCVPSLEDKVTFTLGKPIPFPPHPNGVYNSGPKRTPAGLPEVGPPPLS